jgi:hypothetical protein
MLGVGLRLGSPAVIGMLVLIVILQFVTAPVSAHLTVRVAFRNAQDDERRSAESSARPAADDGPAQLAHALADENDERTASGPGDPAKIADTGAVGKKSGREQRPQR